MLESTKWVGTITSVVGAFFLAFHYMLTGYVLFTIGSGAWFGVGLYTRDKAMVALNAAFLIADFVGLYNCF